MRGSALVITVVVIWAIPCAAGTITVDAKGTGDYPTIQAAIDAATDGDTVILQPGTYTGDGNRDIDFKSKAITVKSEKGAQTCIIDCQGTNDDPHRGFFFHASEDANSILQGFTISNGYANKYPIDTGGGINCDASSPLIKDCIVIANTAICGGGGIRCSDSNSIFDNCIISRNKTTGSYHDSDSGGGVAISGHKTSSCPTFINCIVSGNYAANNGGGINCNGDSLFVNCTIYGNRTGEYGVGGGIKCGFSWKNIASMQNCIIWGNTAVGGEQIALVGGGILGDMRLKLAYCVVQNEPNAIIDQGSRIEGNWISTEPHFSAPGYWEPYEPNSNYAPPGFIDYRWVDGDYHLKSQAGRWDPVSESWVQDDVTSPCIDAGDPNSPIGHEPFPNGGTVNMGAYGGTAEASKSYFGEPVCETIVAGDINGDCNIDIADFTLMAAHWLEDNSP